MPSCPNCRAVGVLYYGGGWCAGCGWHRRGETLAHTNFSPDVTGCEWCREYATQPTDSESEQV